MASVTAQRHPIGQTQAAYLQLVLQNPAKRNAVTPGMLSALGIHIRDAQDDPLLRLSLIRGAGETVCSGFDLSALPGSEEVPDDVRDFPGADILNATTTIISECRIPIIAVIEGPCMGAGGEIAAACDFRIGHETTRFCMPPAKLGLVYA